MTDCTPGCTRRDRPTGHLDAEHRNCPCPCHTRDPFTYPTRAMDDALADRIERDGTAEPMLVMAGGWCGPSTAAWAVEGTLDGSPVTLTLPEVAVRRGGISYDHLVGTPAQQAARAAVRAATDRLVAVFARNRAAAIDTAAVTALAHGWDVHVYDPPTPFDIHRASPTDAIRLRCVGIEFTEAAHPIPTIHHHHTGDDWMYDYEDDD